MKTQKPACPQCTIADAKPPNQMSRCFCSARVADIWVSVCSLTCDRTRPTTRTTNSWSWAIGFALLYHASGSQWGLPHHPVPLCFLNQPVEERIPCLGSRIFRNSGSGADCGHKQIGHFSVEQICSKSHKLSVNSTTRWPADSNCIVAKMHLKRWCPSSILIGVSKEASSTFLCELCSTYAKPHAGSRTV